MKLTAAPPEELIVQVRFIPTTKQFGFDCIQRSYRVDTSGNVVAQDSGFPAPNGMILLGDFLKSALVASVTQQQATGPKLLTLS